MNRLLLPGALFVEVIIGVFTIGIEPTPQQPTPAPTRTAIPRPTAPDLSAHQFELAHNRRTKLERCQRGKKIRSAGESSDKCAYALADPPFGEPQPQHRDQRQHKCYNQRQAQ